MEPGFGVKGGLWLREIFMHDERGKFDETIWKGFDSLNAPLEQGLFNIEN